MNIQKLLSTTYIFFFFFVTQTLVPTQCNAGLKIDIGEVPQHLEEVPQHLEEVPQHLEEVPQHIEEAQKELKRFSFNDIKRFYYAEKENRVEMEFSPKEIEEFHYKFEEHKKNAEFCNATCNEGLSILRNSTLTDMGFQFPEEVNPDVQNFLVKVPLNSNLEKMKIAYISVAVLRDLSGDIPPKWLDPVYEVALKNMHGKTTYKHPLWYKKQFFTYSPAELISLIQELEETSVRRKSKQKRLRTTPRKSPNNLRKRCKASQKY